MKMKLLTALAVLAMAAVASANIMVPNGDFEAGAANWSSFDDGTTVVSYEATGGVNNSGYGLLDCSSGTWGAGFVSPEDFSYPGNDGVPLSFFGVSAGDDITVSMDMKTFSGTSLGGLKIESWGNGAMISNFGGDKPASGKSAEWATYTWDVTLPAGTDALKLVPLVTWNYAPNAVGTNLDAVIGFDNVSVVPEPATMGLFALCGAGLLFVRRHLS